MLRANVDGFMYTYKKTLGGRPNLTLLLYLNDDFEGGDFFFYLRIKRTCGRKNGKNSDGGGDSLPRTFMAFVSM